MNSRHPINTNLTLHHVGPWHGYAVQLQHGPLVNGYLSRIKRTLDCSLLQHPRTLAVRVELRLPESSPFQKECLMNRFIRSLRAQVQADVTRKRSDGKRVHDTAVRYVWAREQEQSEQPHYHLCLFFNRDTYRQVGVLPSGLGTGAATPDPDVPVCSRREPARNLAERIVMAWGRAVGLQQLHEAVGLVHFPVNCTYSVKAGSVQHSNEKEDLIWRISYLAKVKTKSYGLGVRHFDASRR